MISSDRLRRALPWACALTLLLLLGADPTALTVQGPRTQGIPVPMYTVAPGGTSSVQTDVSKSGFASNAAVIITISPLANQQVYLTGIQVTGAGATSAAVVHCTATGLLNGQLQWNIPVPAGATVGITPLVVQFVPPIPNDLIGDPITVTLQAFGTGNNNANLCVTGYSQ